MAGDPMSTRSPGGLLFGAAAFLSYGLVLLAVVPAAVAWHRRRFRPLALAAIGAAPVFLAFLAAGFWWVAGLLATRQQYFAGVGSRRPYLDFLVANAACLAIVLGPAVVVALTRVREPEAVAPVGRHPRGPGSRDDQWDVEGRGRAHLAAVRDLAPARRRSPGRGSTTHVTTGWLGVQATAAIVVATAVKTSW